MVKQVKGSTYTKAITESTGDMCTDGVRIAFGFQLSYFPKIQGQGLSGCNFQFTTCPFNWNDCLDIPSKTGQCRPTNFKFLSLCYFASYE